LEGLLCHYLLGILQQVIHIFYRYGKAGGRMSAGRTRRQRTEEEEFDRLMVEFTMNPGVPRRRGVRQVPLEGVKRGGMNGRGGVRDVEYSELPPERIPELETATDATGSVYLTDSENPRLRHLMQILPVPSDGNCFWAAFATAYHGDTSQWARTKLQTLSYFLTVQNNPAHPRHKLYQTLDNLASQDGSSIQNQLLHPNIWTSAETAQIVADLFNIELVMLYKLAGNPQSGVLFRGAHNRQQVFLYLRNVHWMGLRPARVFPADFRWEYHVERAGCRAHVMESDGGFSVPRALVPWPRVPRVLERDVRRLVGAVDRSEVAVDV
jgi:hypothetical protein